MVPLQVKMVVGESSQRRVYALQPPKVNNMEIAADVEQVGSSYRRVYFG